MRTKLMRVLSVSFGLTAGCLLAAGTWGGYRALRPPPRRITPADHAAVRARLDDNPKAIYMFDAETSYRLKPSFRGLRFPSDKLPHQTNSLGLLGAEDVSDDPAVRKLLFLGDSVTYGNSVPLESAFVTRMQSAAGPKLQLLNAACPGWSTHQELRHYETKLSHLPCELLVVMFCLNDLAKYEWVYGSDQKPELSGEIPQWGEGTAQALKVSLRRNTFAGDPRLAPLAQHHNGFLIAWDSAAWQSFWRQVVAPFLERPHAPQVVFVSLPTPFQLKACALGAPRETALFPQEQLRELCRQAGVAHLDVTEALLEATDADHPLFLDDCHLTEEGHARTARYLWPRLHGLLGGDALAREKAKTIAR